jgi:hypothetical protein
VDYFVKMIESEATEDLLSKPNAFALLAQIAFRAKKTRSRNGDVRQFGQALIGDCKRVGLSKREYRTAKAYLAKAGFVTLEATRRGTVATLVDSSVFDILRDHGDTLYDPLETPLRPPCDVLATTNQEGRRKKGDVSVGDPPPDPGVAEPAEAARSGRRRQKKHEYSDAFEGMFWAEWPGLKTKKTKAYEIWCREGLDDLMADVMAGLRWWKKHAKWIKDDGEFIPYPTTWLNGKYWEAAKAAKGSDEKRAADFLSADTEIPED